MERHIGKYGESQFTGAEFQNQKLTPWAKNSVQNLTLINEQMETRYRNLES